MRIMNQMNGLAILAVTAALASTLASAAPTIPYGKYQGFGRWHDSKGNSGKYTIVTEIQSGKVRTTPIYGGDGDPITYEVAIRDAGNGFFTLQSEGKDAGKGYCGEVQCQYSASFGGTQVQETLTFHEGKLYKIGTKQVGPVTIGWEEALERK